MLFSEMNFFLYHYLTQLAVNIIDPKQYCYLATLYGFAAWQPWATKGINRIGQQQEAPIA
jgi:hypothetical protein